MPAAGQPAPAEVARATRRASTCARASPTRRPSRSRSSSSRASRRRPTLEKEIAKHFSRQEFRRASYADLGELTFPSRAAESYADDLAAHARRRRRSGTRGFRIVVDYCYSSASHHPAARPRGPRGREGRGARLRRRAAARRSTSASESLEATKRLVDGRRRRLRRRHRSGGRADPPRRRARDGRCRSSRSCSCSSRSSRGDGATGALAVPVNATEPRRPLVEGSGVEVRRTQASLAALTKAAAEAGHDLRRARSAEASCFRPSCPPTTRSRASATCCSCSRRSTAPVEPRRRPPASQRSSTGRSAALGAQGHRDADADRADEGAARPICSTGSRSSRSGAGRRSSRTRTSPSSTSMRKGTPRRGRATRGRAARHSSRRSSTQERAPSTSGEEKPSSGG